jgi:nanoRNase/pAp phosphatase (c-di-AMP/oligoRNAs hydrolase)
MTDKNLELIHNTLKDSNSILIPIPEIHGAEILGSALAIAAFLKAEGKNVTILSSYIHLQNSLPFLDLSSISSVIQSTVESVISIDISQYPVESIKYDTTDSQLRIYLHSPSDKFKADLVSIQPGQYPYDLILTLDTKNWTQLGNAFLQYPHIFLETPSIAISAADIPHPYSERTIIENKYLSSAEIVFEYLKAYSRHSLTDKNIINGLLLSLILSNTKNLSLEKTIIKLRELPNDYEVIIQSLESIITDNHRLLIGRILAHLEFINFERSGQNARYAYSKLFTHDFSKTNTTEQDIIIIYRELFKYLPKDIIGLHIVVDNAKSSKQGYLNMPNLDMSNLQTTLEGDYNEGVLVYNYASDKDIHTAGQELNNKILEVLQS